MDTNMGMWGPKLARRSRLPSHLCVFVFIRGSAVLRWGGERAAAMGYGERRNHEWTQMDTNVGMWGRKLA